MLYGAAVPVLPRRRRRFCLVLPGGFGCPAPSLGGRGGVLSCPHVMPSVAFCAFSDRHFARFVALHACKCIRDQCRGRWATICRVAGAALYSPEREASGGGCRLPAAGRAPARAGLPLLVGRLRDLPGARALCRGSSSSSRRTSVAGALPGLGARDRCWRGFRFAGNRTRCPSVRESASSPSSGDPICGPHRTGSSRPAGASWLSLERTQATSMSEFAYGRCRPWSKGGPLPVARS